MAELEKRAAGTPATQLQSEIENLPVLLGRLGDNVMKFVDSKLSLVKVELKEDAAVYARGGAMIAVGGVIAAIGFALVNIAVACFVSLLFANDDASAAVQRYTPKSYGWGFLITGLVYLIIGGVIAYLAKNRLAAYNPVPTASLEEIRKDKQWLKNEM